MIRAIRTWLRVRWFSQKLFEARRDRAELNFWIHANAIHVRGRYYIFDTSLWWSVWRMNDRGHLRAVDGAFATEAMARYHAQRLSRLEERKVA